MTSCNVTVRLTYVYHSTVVPFVGKSIKLVVPKYQQFRQFLYIIPQYIVVILFLVKIDLLLFSSGFC